MKLRSSFFPVFPLFRVTAENWFSYYESKRDDGGVVCVSDTQAQLLDLKSGVLM